MGEFMEPQNTQEPQQPQTMQPTPAPENAAGPQVAIGGVLSRSFTILKQNPALFLGLTLIISLPVGILSALLPEQANGLGNLINTVVSTLIQGSIAYAAFMTLKGVQPSIGDSFNRGMARLLPLVLIALLVNIGAVLGMILLIIPGLMLLCMWYVAIPACMVEQLGPIESIKRSAALTKGYRWTIFWLVVVLMVAMMGLVILAGVLLSPIADLPLLLELVITLILAVPMAFQAIVVAVMYYSLRSAKEDVSLDSLVSVFE